MIEEQDIERRKRIGRLIETEGMTKRAFAEKIGFSYSNLNKIMGGVRGVPNNLPTKIVETFTEVRLEWLLYGEGEMYVRDQQLADTQALQRHMEKLPTRPRLPKFMSEGGLRQYYDDGPKRVLCQEKPIVSQFSDYEFSLILKNNRMSPKYERGDELFFKKASYVEWGNDFLLDTDDGPKFKRIYERIDEKGVKWVRCVSYNKDEFPDFEIERDKVHGFYRCVEVLRIL